MIEDFDLTVMPFMYGEKLRSFFNLFMFYIKKIYENKDKQFFQNFLFLINYMAGKFSVESAVALK